MKNLLTFFQWTDIEKCAFIEDINNNLNKKELEELSEAFKNLADRKENN